MPQKKKSIHLPPLGTESTRSRDPIGTLQLLDDLNVNTILTGLTQSIILHQPKNALRFMYAELGRMIEEEDLPASSSRFDRAAIDSCLLRMRCEYEGPDGSRKISFTRLVSLAETMQRYRAEQQAVQDMHSVFWGRAEEQPSSPEAAVASMAQLAEATSKGDGKNQAVLGLGEAPVRSDAATLVQQMQTQQLEAEVQRLTTALEEAKSEGAMQQLQNGELESEVHKLKAQLAATEAAVEPSDASPEQYFAKWQFWDDCLQTLKQLDDPALMEEFKKFADIQKDPDNKRGKKLTGAAADASTDALDQCRLSKQGLAALFAANKTLSDAEVEELMLRFDTGGDGEVRWHDLRALVRSSSELEMIFKGLPVERVLAACFTSGAAEDPLGAFFSQQHSDVVAALLKARHIVVGMVAALIKKQNEAVVKDLGAGGAKYGAVLKGGTVEAFFEGATGICGEPHPGVSE